MASPKFCGDVQIHNNKINAILPGLSGSNRSMKGRRVDALVIAPRLLKEIYRWTTVDFWKDCLGLKWGGQHANAKAAGWYSGGNRCFFRGIGS